MFLVANPSKAVASTLALARLTDLLVERAPAAGAAPAPPAASVKKLTVDDAALEVYPLDARGTLTCRAIGDASLLATAGFTEAYALSGDGTTPAFAVGVGAFGESFEDCRPRFGELLSVAGATAYLPADGTNVPDYLVARDGAASDVRLLYGFAGSGRFSHVVRFESQTPGAPLALSSVLRACLEVGSAAAIGVVLLAEAIDLVGAALRHSPAERPPDGDFFAHPGVRARLAFTAEPAFPRSVALAAGVISRTPDAGPAAAALRPLGAGCAGHLHAAAFPFRAIKKGRIDLGETVSALFEADAPLGVLHLLNDDRAAAGAGETELVRGACWLAPLAGGGA
jgi:hypothetical protein